MESCTLLVLGSQYGLQIYDWNGAVLVHEMDFEQSGVGAEDRQVPHTGHTRDPGDISRTRYIQSEFNLRYLSPC